MGKIIGFYIGKEETKFNPDVFSVGLEKQTLFHAGYFITVWGVAPLNLDPSIGYLSLAFDGKSDLMDRNVVIELAADSVNVKNDWLGSIPVFYNAKEKVVSTICNLCLFNKETDLQGVANYFSFGYNAFERTVFKDVKFLRYLSEIKVSQNSLVVSYKEDPVLNADFEAECTEENAVIEMMQAYIYGRESSTKGDIILPTSGGYDSRILNYFVQDKSRIRSFTYGISKFQSNSFEVVHAKKISEIFNTKWNCIPLTSFHDYIEDWFKLYGFSTHLHGMYHIEFYKRILGENKFTSPSFLSGIIGDAWAEAGKFKQVNSVDDITALGYSHGMSLAEKHSQIKLTTEDKVNFYNYVKNYIKSDRVKAVMAMRLKLQLISYLTQIPEYFGLPVWTPFLNFNIVKNILNLPDDRRINRAWQVDLFKRTGLNLEEMGLRSSRTNKLNYIIGKKADFEPLDTNLLSSYAKIDRIQEINETLNRETGLQQLINELLYVPKISGVLRRLGFKNKFLIALNEYYVLKALEKGLKYER